MEVNHSTYEASLYRTLKSNQVMTRKLMSVVIQPSWREGKESIVGRKARQGNLGHPHATAASSSSRDSASAPLDIKPLEATKTSDFLLQSHHLLLVAGRIRLVLLQSPLKELVRVIRLKAIL
jgi:hypothetical protein